MRQSPGDHLQPVEGGCLYLYPPAVWEKVRDQVNALPRTRKNSRLFQLKLVGAAAFVELDGSARISIPASQRNAVDALFDAASVSSTA